MFAKVWKQFFDGLFRKKPPASCEETSAGEAAPDEPAEEPKEIPAAVSSSVQAAAYDPAATPDAEEKETSRAVLEQTGTVSRSIQEEMLYNSDFRNTLRRLEQRLHTAEDTSFIIKMTVKTCCLFYEADWCGIIIADRNSRVWSVKYWYDRAVDGMGPTLVRDNEFFEYFPSWVEALNIGDPIVIPDVEAVKDISPREYEGYLRFKAKGVIGAPFGENPTGFLALKNARKYETYPDMVQMLAFVGLSQYYLGEFISSMQEENSDARKVRINLFGTPSIEYRGKVTSTDDYRAPMGWRLLVYLALADKPKAVYEIASALWPEESGNQSENVRSTIYRLRERLRQNAPKDLIINDGGYCLNPAFEVTTDAREMEKLWEQARNETDNIRKIELLKEAFSLYSGEVYADYADEAWLNGYVNHYAILYVQVVNALLETLAEEKDYVCIQEYAGKSLEIATGNVNVFYWLIFALMRTGASDEAKKKIRAAKEVLIEDDYKELVAKLRKEFRPRFLDRFR